MQEKINANKVDMNDNTEYHNYRTVFTREWVDTTFKTAKSTICVTLKDRREKAEDLG